jgi:hypothetical protein
MFMEKITELIQKELDKEKERIERAYNEKLSGILKRISETYDISLRQLLRDVSFDSGTPTVCLGVTKSGKQCHFGGTHGGYCKKHVDQRPVVVAAKPVAQVTQHTHTLPPLFLAGCPVCDESARRRNILALDI